MLHLLAAIASATPQFSVQRGLYDVPFDLVLAPAEGGTVVYGLGGAEPTTPYTGPVRVDRTLWVRAAEIRPDGTLSPTDTHTYVFVDQVVRSPVMDPAIAQDPVSGPIIAASLRELPTVSVVLPTALSLTEQTGSVEWIDPLGDDTQVACGVHIVGGTSWVYPKTSIRLNFRAEHGPTQWEFDVYGDDATGVHPTDSFDAITLRGGNHDSMFWLGAKGQHVRNLWFDETQLEMGHVMPHGRFAHAYVDGVYHGLYHVRERFGAGFMESYYGGDEADYETMTGTYVEDGSGAAWNAVVANAGDFEELARWIDMDQYLDYMVLNYWAGNAWDWWPWHNWMASGPADPNARGGLRFHGNDNDITLTYDWNVNILALGGPSDVFLALMAEGHPDFRVALMDAIHRNLESDGPLTVENATARYIFATDLADDAIWAESARWGSGWWDHDGEWVPERERLLTAWFPQRTDETLRQVRAAGWYPMDAPVIDVAPGDVPAGTVVTVTARSDAELWITTNGRDPRLPGGDLAVGVIAATGEYAVTLERSAVVSARARKGAIWGPLERRFYEIDAPSSIVLNEWSAVDADETLADGDVALGMLPGNGGDWIELVVAEDHLDLRGWRLTMEDRIGPAGDLTFTQDALLADLAAGTIITIAEDLAEDPAYDPAGGDWRFHLRAADGATGAYVTAADFDVTPLDWQLTLWDAAGTVRFGPVGEAVEPRAGISGSEVGRLQGPANADVRRHTEAYGDGASSTYGAPNTWSGGVQDLGWGVDFAPEDPPEIVDEPADGVASVDPASGCATTAAPPWLGLLALLLVACKGYANAKPADPADPDDTAGSPAVDLDRDGAPAGVDCDDADPLAHPDAAERCDAVDNDCDGIVDEAGGVVDGLPFFADADGDGYGSDAIVGACALADGLALAGGDCADDDPARHPDATELCDLVDQDCDGSSEDDLGASADCPATSCLDLLAEVPGAADGAYWLAGADGALQAWCDMTTDGGGWTLGLLRNSAAVGNLGGFGGADLDNGALGVSPADASASAAGHLGWLDLNARAWTELVVTAYGAGSPTYRSRTIPRTDIRIPFGADGYLLYGGPTGYYWCGGTAAYTDAGVGATNNPPSAPPDCKAHGSLGSGWDFSESEQGNQGLTLCGSDASNWIHAGWAGAIVYSGTPGAAQALWIR